MLVRVAAVDVVKAAMIGIAVDMTVAAIAADTIVAVTEVDIAAVEAVAATTATGQIEPTVAIAPIAPSRAMIASSGPAGKTIVEIAVIRTIAVAAVTTAPIAATIGLIDRAFQATRTAIGSRIPACGNPPIL
jgi:hypothetical protein